MKELFGQLPNGENCHLYTIASGKISAKVTDLGASLVRLYIPGKDGSVDDVVLGYDSPAGYLESETYFGATVGRNANRMRNASFVMGGKTYILPANDGNNNLHSGPDGYNIRRWNVLSHTQDSIVFSLQSPHGDQGFPGNATIRVTYKLESDSVRIIYDAVSDRDTVFNFTNHTYFNPDDAENIPTGELRPVDGTPMDFRIPKSLSRDIREDYEPLHLQKGYDHNFEVYCNPAAILSDPDSGRSVAVYTDRPGIQIYTANFTKGAGKDGMVYEPRCGVCLETQFYPDAVNHPEWPQPFVQARQHFHSETKYRFTW